MVLIVQKLSLFPLKFPSKLETDIHHKNTTSLQDFRAEISNFITQILLKPGNDNGSSSKSQSLELLQNCFELINITNRAFAKLMVKINHPTSQWSGKITDEYLSYTLKLLDLVNSVTASISHLNQAKISVFQALSLVKNSPTSAAKYLKKIRARNHIQDKNLIPFSWPTGIDEESPVFDQKERVILQAFMVLKKIVFLVMGFILSGLCSHEKIYLEIRKSFPGEFDDPLVKTLDSRFCEEIIEIHGGPAEIKEVNRVVEGLPGAGRFEEAVGELSRRLEALESSIQGIEEQASNLFSQVLGTRNKLLDNIRFMG